MRFAGFTDETFSFYEGLLADNSKAYWTEHKAIYEEHVRAPVEALLAELEPEFGQVRMFRPNRDLRFSSDKSPYKLQQGGHVGDFSGGFYFHVNADGLRVGGGFYAPTAEQLTRYREAVDEEGPGERLAAIVDELRADGFEIGGDRLKTRPRGISPDHPRLELLRHRSLSGFREWPPEPWAYTAEAVDRVRDGWRRLRPLVSWCVQHLRPA